MAIMIAAVIRAVDIPDHTIHHTHHTMEVVAYIKVSTTQAIYQEPIK